VEASNFLGRWLVPRIRTVHLSWPHSSGKARGHCDHGQPAPILNTMAPAPASVFSALSVLRYLPRWPLWLRGQVWLPLRRALPILLASGSC
jgi:hypothetical protein